jgi:riboflavin biosynthesis pyrimidine reductase
MAKPDYVALSFPPPPPDRPYVVVNMVMSADGKVVLGDTEQGIGSTVDQRLMRELRVHADVVLNGAETLRKSGTSSRLGGFEELELVRKQRGKSRFAIAATLSSSGDLPLDKPFFVARDFDAIVYLGEETPTERRSAIEATGRSIAVLPREDRILAMLRHMRHDLGANLLLLEGGPSLNAEFFAVGAIDELFFSVGALIIGGKDAKTPVEGPGFAGSKPPRLQLVSATPNEETNEVYLRYRVLHESRP